MTGTDPSVETPSIGGVLSRIDADISELLRSDWSRPTDDEVLELLRAADQITRRLAAVDHQLLGQALNRGIADTRGYRDSATLLAQLTASTRSQARARVASAQMFGPRRSLTGEDLGPLLPVAADAARDGLVSAGQATVIAETVRAVPTMDQPKFRDLIDVELTDYAIQGHHPATLKQIGARILAHLDPDGDEPRDRQADWHRGISLRELPDGCGELRGRLTPGCLAVWQATLHPLLTSPSHNSGTAPDFETEPATQAVAEPGSEPIPDDRTIGQRLHDAFEQAAQRLLAIGDLPATAGVPTTLIVSMTLDQLEARAGQATTHHGGLISVQAAMRLGVDAKVLPVVFDQQLGTLAYGRARRLASPGQRLALFARDKGCTFPGCRKTAAQSQIHHLTDWADGGPTNLDNLAITCGYHNNQAPKHGWTAHLHENTVWWIPPTHIDPQQKPRHNPIHRT